MSSMKNDPSSAPVDHILYHQGARPDNPSLFCASNFFLPLPTFLKVSVSIPRSLILQSTKTYFAEPSPPDLGDRSSSEAPQSSPSPPQKKAFSYVVYVPKLVYGAGFRQQDQMPNRGPDEAIAFQRFLEALREKTEESQCVVLISSVEVYGDGIEASESVSPEPTTMMGICMYSLELQLRAFHRRFPSVDFLILRAHDVYGLSPLVDKQYKSVGPSLEIGAGELLDDPEFVWDGGRMFDFVFATSLAKTQGLAPRMQRWRPAMWQLTFAPDLAKLVAKLVRSSEARNQVINVGSDSWYRFDQVCLAVALSIAELSTNKAKNKTGNESLISDRGSSSSSSLFRYLRPVNRTFATNTEASPFIPFIPGAGTSVVDASPSLPRSATSVSHIKQRQYLGDRLAFHGLEAGIQTIGRQWMRVKTTGKNNTNSHAKPKEQKGQNAVTSTSTNRSSGSSPSVPLKKAPGQTPIVVAKFSKVAVLVQLKVTTGLVPVIGMFLAYLPEDWKFQIFGSPGIHRHLNQSILARFVASGKLLLTPLPRPSRSKEEYSYLLTTVAFWEAIVAEKVLIFQLDSILCSASAYRVDDFLEYDYIGAPWSHHETTPIKGFLPPNGGNGGLSLRTRSLSLKAIRTVPYNGDPEDVYFSRNIALVGGRVANRSVAEKFSVEGSYYIGAAGVHAPWLASPSINPRRKEFREALEKFCPEYKMNGRYKEK